MALQEFMGYLTQAGVTGVIAFFLYLERQRADRLQKEKDDMIKTTLETVNGLSSSINSMHSTLTTVMDVMGAPTRRSLLGKMD